MRRQIKAPTGPWLSCRSWHHEAAPRMLMDNLMAVHVRVNPDLQSCGSVDIGQSLHAGMVCVAEGTDAADHRMQRVLTAEPDIYYIMRHADVGYPEALAAAREHGIDVPMINGGRAGR